MPKVSVIVPTYNSIAYLPETIESILQQTFTDFEVLIVDDGSTDQTVAWAKQIVDPRVRVIMQPNQGVSVARNTGILQAQGEYVAFLDADDTWNHSKLEQQVYYLDTHPKIGWVHSWVSLIDAQSQPIGKPLISSAEGQIWEELLIRNAIACCSVMVRRSCFSVAGLFDPNIRSAEDWELWIRLAFHYPIGLIKEPLARYRVLPTSKSKNCQLVERSLHQIIEKTFADIPLNYQSWKSRSYGYAYLYLAWKALQGQTKDISAAIRYRQQAKQYCPRLRYSVEYLRLGVAIGLIQVVGGDRYTLFLRTVNRLQGWITQVQRINVRWHSQQESL
ncbi:glycosyltransferase family 2 protein [Thermocoleostomius sinensis]|uniref:Glycosyltransferase n=1 Tax=Thermocoleostomius sinensis A174 TaxID=2016057 RepID=A0A9E8ZFS9_9CYAN|nr:glycosyltransferase [Thermocoleostomius sinensis]WAL62604.1 glycosyltransferase [Thermocoleostomius sinensis A174]